MTKSSKIENVPMKSKLVKNLAIKTLFAENTSKKPDLDTMRLPVILNANLTSDSLRIRAGIKKKGHTMKMVKLPN